MRERSVVREQQHAFDVGVETADGIEPHVAGHEVGDDGTPLRIAHGGDVAARLVEEQIPERLGARERATVDGDDVDVRIGQRRQLTGHDPVDGDAALGDEALSPPP